MGRTNQVPCLFPSRLEAIAIGLEAIAFRLEVIASRLEAIAFGLEISGWRPQLDLAVSQESLLFFLGIFGGAKQDFLLSRTLDLT